MPSVIPEKLCLWMISSGFEGSRLEVVLYFSDLSADTWSC